MVAAFAFRYFCVLIIFACVWSSFLSLDLPGGSPKLPKHLLDWYSSYPRRINSSDYILPSFPYVILHSGSLLIIYSSSDVSISSNRAQGSIFQFGLLPPQLLTYIYYNCIILETIIIGLYMKLFILPFKENIMWQYYNEWCKYRRFNSVGANWSHRYNLHWKRLDLWPNTQSEDKKVSEDDQ